ncbi:hypothetical protein LCGC14_2457950, partial [marine sediment metagenome]
MPRRKTTKKHYELFKSEANFWLKYFGLSEWDVKFCHVKLEGGSKARCTYNLVGRAAT